MHITKYLLLACLFFPLRLLAQNISEIGYTEEGTASYYTDNRNGATTSSGEKYDMYALEGAHKFIAFNTLVRVTNLENQRTAYVRINDRPYTNTRIMDLTLGAARKLGMVGNAMSKIKIEIVANNVFRQAISNFAAPPRKSIAYQKPPQTNQMLVNSEPVTLSLSTKKLEAVFKPVSTYSAQGQTVYPKGFGIQMGSFTDVKVALEKAKELEQLQLNNVYIQAGWSNSKKIYRVIFGNFNDRAKAVFMENNLKNGFEGIFVKKHLLSE